MRARSRPLVAALAAAVVFVGAAAACSSEGDSSSATTSTDAPVTSPPTTRRPRTTTSTTTTTVPVGPQTLAALEAALTSTVPAGFVRRPDAEGDAGPSDLAKAARDEGSMDGGSELRAERFVRGYQRSWANARGDEIVLFVYQFADQAGATSNFDRSAGTLEVLGYRRAIPVPLDGFAAGSTVAMASGDAASAAEVAAITHRGAFVVLVRQRGGTLASVRRSVAALLRDQVERLGVGTPTSVPAGAD